MSSEEKRLMVEGVRLFFDLSLDFIDQLRYGLNNLRELSQTRKYKELRGKEFGNKDLFIMHSRTKYSEINLQKQIIKSENKKSNDKQMKILKQLCKKRGVDIYLEKCPKNIDELVDKYNNGALLSIKEQEYVDAFTDKDKDGNIIKVYHEGGVLMFNAQDINLMSDIVKDVEQKTMNIQKRKIKAKEKVKKVNEKARQTRNIEKAR